MFLVCLLPEAAKMIAEHQHPGLFEENKENQNSANDHKSDCQCMCFSCDAEASNYLYVVILVSTSNNQFATFFHFHRNSLL